MMRVKELLESKKFVRHHVWVEKDIEHLNKHLFLTAKPIIYLVNLSEKDYIRKVRATYSINKHLCFQKNKYLPKIKEWVDTNDEGGVLIPFSGIFELKTIEVCSTVFNWLNGVTCV